MVIVPGINDGDVLEQSLEDLWQLGDAMLSVAVVPVGLTQFTHLYTGQRMHRDIARALLDRIARRSAAARCSRAAAVGVRIRRAVSAGGAAPSRQPRHYERLRADRERRRRGGRPARTDRRGRSTPAAAATGRRIGVVTGTAMARTDARVFSTDITRAHRRLVRAHGRWRIRCSADGDDGGVARGRRHPPRARRTRRSRSRADSGGDDQRRRAVPGRRTFVVAREKPCPCRSCPSYDFMDVLEDEGAASPRAGAHAA